MSSKLTIPKTVMNYYLTRIMTGVIDNPDIAKHEVRIKNAVYSVLPL